MKRQKDPVEPSSGYDRLEWQIDWYDRRSSEAQCRYKLTKVVEFLSVAAVPVAAHYNVWLTSILGALAFCMEGIQQLFQWHQLWIAYRSTCEALRHEKYSYLGRTGDYDVQDDIVAKKLLIERVESLVSSEHSKWVSKQMSAEKRLAKHS